MRLPLEYSINFYLRDETKENLWLILGFLMSLFHEFLCGLFFLLLLILMNRGAVGCIKAILIVVARTTIISPIIAVDVSGLSIIKWLLIFLFAANIVFLQKVKNNDEKKTLQALGFLLSAYILYIFIIALIKSSFPVVSVFKSISYAFVFFAILKGIAISYDNYDWIKFLHMAFSVFFIISFVTMPITSLRHISIHYFQGIANHPNNFAIYAAAYVALLLNSMEKYPKLNIVMILLVLFMIYVSRSRTSMFACVAMFLIYFMKLIRYRHENAMYAIVIITFALIALYALFSDKVTSIIEGFVYKGGASNILRSRNIQIKVFNEQFSKNPFTGTGFMVPFEPNTRDFGFSFNLFVERGNILFAVLGDTGVVGMLLFLLLYGYIFVSGYKKRIILFLFPFIVSSGEMVFFSTNSMGVLLYVFFGIFLFSKTPPPSNIQNKYKRYEASDEKILTIRI